MHGARSAIAVVALLVLAACTSHPPGSRAAATPSPSGSALAGSLQIAADSTLDPVMNQLADAFTAAHPGVRLLPVSYSGTQALATAVQQGATPDVVAVADATALAQFGAGNAVVSATVRPFALDPLVIVVKAANPSAVQSLGDLAKPGMSVVLPDPSLPVGAAAERALAAAGVRLTPAKTELQAAAVVQDVGSGILDAGVVYASDLAGGGSSVTGLAIPARDNAPATETAAAMANSPNQQVAGAFVAFLASTPARSILTAAGFLLPPG
jgi:molybdate transport system substrate-binding protein